MWGKNREEEEDRDSDGPAADGPDERTWLLPNQINSRPALLTPDDPAVRPGPGTRETRDYTNHDGQVSPFNLWTVRVMRYVTFFMVVLSLAWWALLLISAFATPPGMHTRGSGFFALGNATVAVCLLVFNLAFFGTPSKSTRGLCAFMAVWTLNSHGSPHFGLGTCANGYCSSRSW